LAEPKAYTIPNSFSICSNIVWEETFMLMAKDGWQASILKNLGRFDQIWFKTTPTELAWTEEEIKFQIMDSKP
jgi:hypothetical protein